MIGGGAALAGAALKNANRSLRDCFGSSSPSAAEVFADGAEAEVEGDDALAGGGLAVSLTGDAGDLGMEVVSVVGEVGERSGFVAIGEMGGAEVVVIGLGAIGASVDGAASASSSTCTTKSCTSV